jgi:hypothetical protein
MKIIALSLASLAALPAAAYTFDAEVPQATRDQITTDLAFMGTLQGDVVSPLHQQIFGVMDGTGYVKFFESRVTNIGLDDCGDAKAVACVIPWMGSSRIWLTPNYTKFSHPQIAKMMVVFHEARHTETGNRNWQHANCPRPFLGADGKEITSIWTGSTLAGAAACDSTPFGSYGSSTILLKNIARNCKNCTDKVKMDAGLYADDQFKRIVGQSAKDAMQKDIFGP